MVSVRLRKAEEIIRLLTQAVAAAKEEQVPRAHSG